jgi:hypothetical protein
MSLLEPAFRLFYGAIDGNCQAQYCRLKKPPRVYVSIGGFFVLEFIPKERR